MVEFVRSMEKGRLAHQSASDHLRDRRTFETVAYCILTFKSLVVAENPTSRELIEMNSSDNFLLTRFHTL